MTKRLITSSVVAAAVLFAGPVSAQEPVPASERGAIQVGLRLGYGLPFGYTGRTPTDLTDEKLSETIKGQVPIWVDAGYLINPNMYVGLSFLYGFGFLGSDASSCEQPGIGCSTDDIRLGANFHYHLSPAASFDPWLGFGVGYEWLGISASGPGGSASGTATGFEFANIQLGGDIKLAPGFAAGPFVSFSAGQYSSTSITLNNTTTSQDIIDESFHEWLLFGFRGVYNIRL